MLFNVQVFTEGFDLPEIDCILLARPSKSPAFLMQMIGRGTRLVEGKRNCLILDVAHAHRVTKDGGHAGGLIRILPLFYPQDSLEGRELRIAKLGPKPNHFVSSDSLLSYSESAPILLEEYDSDASLRVKVDHGNLGKTYLYRRKEERWSGGEGRTKKESRPLNVDDQYVSSILSYYHGLVEKTPHTEPWHSDSATKAQIAFLRI